LTGDHRREKAAGPCGTAAGGENFVLPGETGFGIGMSGGARLNEGILEVLLGQSAARLVLVERGVEDGKEVLRVHLAQGLVVSTHLGTSFLRPAAGRLAIKFYDIQ
jgi:hypothetical protein